MEATPRRCWPTVKCWWPEVSITARVNQWPMRNRYHPARGAWRSLSRLIAPRSYHTATLLQNGKVLMSGRRRRTLMVASPVNSSAELYDSEAALTPSIMLPFSFDSTIWISSIAILTRQDSRDGRQSLITALLATRRAIDSCSRGFLSITGVSGARLLRLSPVFSRLRTKARLLRVHA